MDVTEAQEAQYRAAKEAFYRGDLSYSNDMWRAFLGLEDSFIHQAKLNVKHPPAGIQCRPMSLPHGPTGFEVEFDEALVYLADGKSLPITLDGTAYTHPFLNASYGPVMLRLMNEGSSPVLQELARSKESISDIITISHSPVYYHYIVDFLPHFISLQRNNNTDATLLIDPNTSKSAWQKQVLQHSLPRFGIQNYKVGHSDRMLVKAKSVKTMPPLPLRDRIKILRLLVDQHQDVPETPYIFSQRSPSDKRQLENEQQVIEALGPRFSVVRPDQIDFPTQLALFSKAKCIVGVHGSNLTNIAFAEEGAGVVELAAGTAQIFFQKIAQHGGMQYRRVEGTLNSADESDPRTQHHDFTVNPQEVVDAVEQVVAE